MQQLDLFLQELNVPDQSQILDKFAKYYDYLIESNKKFNLTALTEQHDVEIKHFIDSLMGEALILPNSKVCDIGSGAGFPSIPLALIRSDCEFCLVDSLAKRVNFLNELISLLQLKNCRALHARAEDFARAHKNEYDVCVARAIAPMPTLIEYTLPLLKVGGILLAYKGSNVQEEINQSAKALDCLYASVESVHDATLPNGDYRAIVEIKKLAKCPPCYPRTGNKPRLKPLA